MDREKLREAVDVLKQFGGELSDPTQTLLDLAESVLAVGGKMPRKIEKYRGFALEREEVEHNRTIDDCTLAFAGIGLSIDWKYIISAIVGCKTEKEAKEIIDAILSAMKGGGE